MLKIKPICEHCMKSLPNESSNAMICTFECTFCSECVDHILNNVCPNCGGGFEKRPTRPKHLLDKYPASSIQYYKPIDSLEFALKLKQYENIKPNQR